MKKYKNLGFSISLLEFKPVQSKNSKTSQPLNSIKVLFTNYLIYIIAAKSSMFFSSIVSPSYLTKAGWNVNGIIADIILLSSYNEQILAIKLSTTGISLIVILTSLILKLSDSYFIIPLSTKYNIVISLY